MNVGIGALRFKQSLNRIWLLYEHFFAMGDYSHKKEPAVYVESSLLQFYLTLLLVIEDVLFCCLRYSCFLSAS